MGRSTWNIALRVRNALARQMIIIVPDCCGRLLSIRGGFVCSDEPARALFLRPPFFPHGLAAHRPSCLRCPYMSRCEVRRSFGLCGHVSPERVPRTDRGADAAPDSNARANGIPDSGADRD